MTNDEPTHTYQPDDHPPETLIPAPADAHPPLDRFLLFLDGHLEGDDARTIQEHFDSCEECSSRVKKLQDTLSTIVGPHGASTTDPANPGSHRPRVTAADKGAECFGDFQILDEIARGGMGVVYKARQLSLNRVVALKMIRSGGLADQEELDRFAKEAEAAANLDHPGIVPVYEVGELDGQHFFTMGFVDGESLSDRLREGPLPARLASKYAKEISEAVAYAHSKGVIHRDLKPANVLITKDGVLRLTDFGLAKQIEDDNELTTTGQVMGTPSYMPPEQAEGRLSEIGATTDIYSIGATLYCMLVGRPPFQAASMMETLQQVLHSEPVSLSSQNSTVPLDLETLCLKCLEKQPARRYASAQDLVDELDRYLNGQPLHARPVGKIERAARWCQRQPIAAGLLASIILLAVSAVTFSTLLVRSNNRAARERVTSLLNANPVNIPLLLDDLDQSHRVVGGQLRELAEQDLASHQRLRVSLALLPFDSKQVEELSKQMNDCGLDELTVVLQRLKDHGGDQLIPDFWKSFRETSDKSEQFRAGIALAVLDPRSANWRQSDYRVLVDTLLEVNTLYQPLIRQAMAPIGPRLVPAVEQIYQAVEPGTLAEESSANALVDFASSDTKVFVDLSCISTAKQHSVVFPVVERMAASDHRVADNLVAITKLQPADNDDEAARIRLGKRRAGAAINLIRLRQPQAALEVLRVSADPESRTQFIHTCNALGVDVSELLDLMNSATSVSARYGLLLALGEYELTEIPESTRNGWVNYVKNLYANDPSSAIHGASGWLLRRWEFHDAVRRVDETPLPFDETLEREWYVLGIDLPDSDDSAASGRQNRICFTMTVVRPGEYVMGTPAYETGRYPEELLHRVKLTRPLAISAHEVTWAQFDPFDGASHRATFENQFGRNLGPETPTFGVSWFDVIAYCRWLSAQAGVTESEQCYESGLLANYEIERPGFYNLPQETSWDVNLDGRGFRLPTAAEWESVCRAGTRSAYSFGSDRTHLNAYAWDMHNARDWSQAVRQLRPNPVGLFDIHGNLNEWCHDRFGDHVASAQLTAAIQEQGPLATATVDPVGPDAGTNRVVRGGSWADDAMGCRSGNQSEFSPTGRTGVLGFRVVLVPQSGSDGKTE